MRKTAFFAAWCLLLTASGPALSGQDQWDITTRDLIEEMVSLERLSRLPPLGERHLQFSSYDRRSRVVDGKTVDWWANRDFGNYLRMEKTSRGYEFVMAEAEGPGAIVRMWSANPGGRTWRIYLDGDDQPVIETAGKKLLGGAVPPWGKPFAQRRNLGANFIFPIAFSRSVKVTVQDPVTGPRPPPMYYHVNLRMFAPETRVKPFSIAELRLLKSEVEATARILADPDSLIPAGESASAGLELRPGAEETLFDFSGEKAVVLFEVEIQAEQADLAELLGKSLLLITFDEMSRPAVAAPLNDFFGASPGAPEMRTLPSSIIPTSTGAQLKSRWVMPFKSRAEIKIVNQSSRRLSLSARAVIADREFGEDSIYFHAGWRERDRIPTRPPSDFRMLEVRGRGRFVGLTMNVRNPMNLFWWGEGDEKIWVDDDEFPSIFGTGTEDYFGYAWCVQYFKFTHAYHGVSVPTTEFLVVPQVLPFPFLWEAISRATRQPAVVSQYRWQILDDIPFSERLLFDMEILHHRNTEIDVNAAAFWYAEAGSEDDATVPDLGAREVWAPRD